MANPELDLLFLNYAWRQLECVVTMGGKSVHGRRILLPLPPSENKRLMPARCSRRLINTSIYSHWLIRARDALNKNKLGLFVEDPKVPLFVFTILVYSDLRRDVVNYEKAIYDAFQTSSNVLVNDRQIKERHTKGFYCKEAPCEYVISYLLKQDDLPPVYDFAFTAQEVSELNDYVSRGFEANGCKVLS